MMVTFRAPTTSQVQEALRRIPTFQLRRAFFEGLNNPMWIGPLAQEKVFLNPPDPEVASDGLVQDFYWPEIDYLIRMATMAPHEVVDILLVLRRSSNAWVRRAAFTIGASIPADEAARLWPLFKSWLPTGFGWRTDPREQVELTVNLLVGGQYDFGKWLANALFRPNAAQGRRQSAHMLEDYWYEQGLPKVVAALGNDAMSVVLPWLVALERGKGRFKKGLDFTHFGRDSVRTRGDSHPSIENALVDATRDTAIRAMLIDPTGAKVELLSTKMLIGRKIALFALGEALHQTVDVEQQHLLVSVAEQLLFDPQSLDEACRIDYGELARATWKASPGALDPLVALLPSGPSFDESYVRRRLGEDGSADGEIDERAIQYTDGWMHRWLSVIGAEALPAQLRGRLAELDIKFGVIDKPLDPRSQVGIWVGPRSPLSQDEMAAMSPPEILAHLETWRSEGDGWGFGASHEGQGRELTELLSTNPKALSGSSPLGQRLRPTYLRAIIRGWEAALKAGLDLPWGSVGEVISGVLGHSIESLFPREGDRLDDDSDFREAKKAAVSLLTELAVVRTNLAIPEDSAVVFANLLIADPGAQESWENYNSHASGSGMDPLTVSLNWEWPIRVRGLIRLISRGMDTGWYSDAHSALEHELLRSDARGASRAVLGEGIGRLVSVDPGWARDNRSAWFGDVGSISENQQIALTTALAVHYYHRVLYDFLSPAMLAAISLEEPIAEGWHVDSDSRQRLGEWIVEGIIRGEETVDGVLPTAYFKHVPAKVRGEAIGNIAWTFMHAEAVDDVIRDGLADLWDIRVAHVRSHPEDRDELGGFLWFVKSGKFPVEWWLPRLRDALELNPNLSSERSMVGKELAISADSDPRTALEVLKLLIQGREEASLAVYDLTRNAVPMVIARGISSQDGALRTDAKAFMNFLGEQGYRELEKEVIAVISGTIGQEDLED